ncbi:MAG: hypothetical protein IT377_06135 [Polyangiaceae bacterium]|nr:hypothetical protein [Polyangiaceae bacterium]
MRLLSSLVPLVALGLFVACGSSKKRAGDAYGTEEQVCQHWAEAACNAKVVEACAAASVESCVAKQTTYCLGSVPPYYSSENAKTCIEKVEAAYSDAKLTAEEVAVVRNMGAPCDKLNQGLKALGEVCEASDQCNSIEDQVCVIKPGDDSGSCQVPKLVGGGYSCTAADELCDVGFYCDGSNCIAKKGDGQACTKDIPCLEDFLCVDSGGQGKCVAKGGTAAGCDADFECKSGICAKPATGSGKCVESVVLTPTDPVCQSLG